MLLKIRHTVFALILCLITQSSAQNITASTCVSPSGFTQCYSQVETEFESCVVNSGADQNKVTACSCVGVLGQLNCAMTNCWNVVYGCEYQALANLYAGSCSFPVPFFPAPDNAPGGCACNLGYVLYNATYAAIDYKNCVGSNVDQNDGCTCCYQAAGYAALYNICPNTSPTYADLPGADGVLDVSDPNLKQGQCAADFAQYNCSSLGYTGLGVPFMTAFDAATLGTGTLSNSDSRTISSPVSGATFTWTDLGLAYTIVAASVGAHASASSSSGGHSGAGSSASRTASGSAQSSTAAQGNGAGTPTPQGVLAWFIVGAVLLQPWL